MSIVGKETEVNISKVMYDQLLEKKNKFNDTYTNVTIYYSLFKNHILLVAVTTDEVNYPNEYKKLSYMTKVRETLKLEEHQIVIGFCAYEYSKLFIRNKKLYIDLYLSRLWSYTGGGIGLLLMYLGYELGKYYINDNQNTRKQVIDNLLYQPDLFYSLVNENIVSGFKIGNYNGEDKVKKLINYIIENINIKIQVALTFHDDSVEFNKKTTSYYNFILKETNRNKSKGLIEHISQSSRRGDTKNSGYKIDPMRSSKSAYYIFNKGEFPSYTKSSLESKFKELLPNVTLVDLGYSDLTNIITLYDQSKYASYNVRRRLRLAAEKEQSIKTSSYNTSSHTRNTHIERIPNVSNLISRFEKK